MSQHRPIWSLTAAEVLKVLDTHQQGLSEAEVVLRLQRDGYNELPEPPRRPIILRFLDQLTHFMALLLWVAGILAFISHTPELGWAIWAVIWINAVFSFWQEFQAERALAELKKVLPLQAKVYRDGRLVTLPVRELVVGDVVQLEEGDRISTDARLVEAESLYVDVSILTGESLLIARHADPVEMSANQHPTSRLRPTEAGNLVFAGSTVVSGRGLGVVYATGSRTEFGHVAQLTTRVVREPSTLELQISRIVRVITVLAIGMGISVFLLSYWLIGMEARESFIFSIGIIVANVPEGLLPTVTLALAVGVRRMARQNALVRRLSSVETLSATTVICTDKTGTLTKNEMTVRRLWMAGRDIAVKGVGYVPDGTVQLPTDAFPALNSYVRYLMAGSALCSNAHLLHPPGSSQWQEIGDPTEAALLVAAIKSGLNLEELHQRSPRLRELPFDSRRRMMTVVVDWQLFELWQSQTPYLSFTKGAPLEVLRRCQNYLDEQGVVALTEAKRAEIAEANDRLAREGFRVIGVAVRSGETELLTAAASDLEQNLTFLGLAAMIDPPRPKVKAAIARCLDARITVTMVTGDYGLTAEAIARQIGLVDGKATVITGETMGHLSDAELRQLLHQPQNLIFARALPEQKLRLVQAYKDSGHVVAVTGDGVNDAPALRAANIGIAMGLNGTDVAREAADIVLLDDNFATIVTAIEQGRAIYQNIRKFMTYILASNIPEIVPFLAMVFLRIPPALIVLQILAIDLGTDLVPALALGAEAPETGIMQQPPRPKHKPLLDRSLLVRAYLFLGVIEAIAGMAAFFIVWWSHGYTLADIQQISFSLISHTADPNVTRIYHQATTATLAAIVACQIGNVFACRSERVSSLRLGWFSNPWIWIGIALEILFVLLLVYVYPLNQIFMLAPLAGWQWASLILCPIVLLAAEEWRKQIANRIANNQEKSRLT
ncbi:cation-translocating P-type ATPase [Thermocoleostomius sinensis]|uniref:Cation-transporting P-type ATPase n=1 Tax=Thermocoleostomius sinensis A174 TaxID=2016057 RepID=A0A9E8ZGU3_9CYAN|nr:cation-transporting P-type ATPase [Thermocoleostomius sinensis]WAL58271.1 cation-transporting P-type ATPase [Thermocoleostomius sinensis A174]